MIADMGLQNGTVFLQSLPSGDDFYVHDMGYRLGGGMSYRSSQGMYGINDMKMMIALALGEQFYTPEELEKVDLLSPKYSSCAWMVPLNAGTIAEIKGLDTIEQDPAVSHVIQNYHIGDTVAPSAVGTLNGHFARISLRLESIPQVIELVNRLQDGLSIKDTEGNEMYTMRFDTNRLLEQ